MSYGDTDDDTGPIVSFGFATEAEKRDGAWTNPVGTCLFHKYVEDVHPEVMVLLTTLLLLERSVVSTLQQAPSFNWIVKRLS